MGLYQKFEHFLGRGGASVTIPPMDGALKPNNRLDGARSVATMPAPDNLAAIGNDVLFSTGAKASPNNNRIAVGGRAAA